MNRAQHMSFGVTLLTVCLSVAVAVLISQSNLARVSVRPAPSNHAQVINSMSADLRDFRMCNEQAQMLAEQTADFGVLGMMTTVEAIGIDTRPLPIQQTASGDGMLLQATRNGWLSARF